MWFESYQKKLRVRPKVCPPRSPGFLRCYFVLLIYIKLKIYDTAIDSIKEQTKTFWSENKYTYARTFAKRLENLKTIFHYIVQQGENNIKICFKQWHLYALPIIWAEDFSKYYSNLVLLCKNKVSS